MGDSVYNCCKLKDLVSTYMDELAVNGYFSGSILVGYKGEKLINQGYGYACHQYDVKNTRCTKFKIGSLTKAFTAMAVLQLEEQGKISLTDSLSKYIVDFPSGSKVTIQQLLNHTSGIKDFVCDPEYWTKTMRLPTTLESTINLFKNLPLNFEPGTKFEYSNSNYTILAYLIEKVSITSYEEFLKHNIFEPLGMENTGCDDGKAIIKNYAEGYTIWKNLKHADFIDMSIAKGTYGLYSTVEDLYIWHKALYTEKLVSKKQLDKMFNICNGACGFDWFCELQCFNSIQKKKMYHFGDVNGYVSFFSRYVEDDLAIIVLSNFNLTPVEKISDDIAKIVFGEKVDNSKRYEAKEVPTSLRNVITGDFNSCSGVHLNLSIEEGKIYLTIPKRYGVLYKYEMVATDVAMDKIKFRTKFVDETIILDFKQDGTIKLTHIDAYNNHIKAEKR